jgi:glycosyltransferase involved in cell wall biosynthesis
VREVDAPRILHVLPHDGGGGETYLRQLGTMAPYRFDRVALTRRGRMSETPGGLLRLARAIPKHDLVHIHGDSAGLVCWPLIGRRPTVITLHGSHLLRRSKGPAARAVRLGIQRAFGRADAVIAVSESESDYARAIAPHAVRIELIRNGISVPDPVSDADRRRVRERLGLTPGSIAALFVGELSHRKQPLQFAEAVRTAREQSPEIVGLLAGDGPLLGLLEPMQGDGLRLLGRRSDVNELMVAADVFVLPSLREGLSYAVLEAMALGKATLVSDGPGNPDAVGDTGLIFAAGDVSAMAASLLRLAADPELCASLGERAIARVRERFTLSDMREATARVYEQALHGSTER